MDKLIFYNYMIIIIIKIYKIYNNMMFKIQLILKI